MRGLPGICLIVSCLLPPSSQAGFTTPAQTFTFDGQEVSYHLRGEPGAPAVIVLGGGPGFSSWNLEPIQRRLAELGYRAAIMDMAGVGENAMTIEGGPLASWVGQIEGLRRTLVANRSVTLVGHSWGALMALVYTRAHPERVDRLLLINPVDPERRAMRTVVEQIDIRRARELGERWDDESRWKQPANGDREEAEHTRHQIERTLPAYFADWAQGRRYAAQFDETDFRPELNVEGWRAYGEEPVRWETIRGWNVPIGFIGCRQDLLMPTNLDRYRAELELARVSVLKDCVHFPWEEVPVAFDAALGAHLGRKGGSKRGS
ncbi:MAG: alpha/beta fold hydrolase [Pseudomonadota bacterium]